ncbi:MAG: aminoacyl-tRNA hydrolase [Fimbriimonadales bacterium]|nr:aminoacyl-tRNA hydrolase [Fimbriimonadales bacterium]
MRLFRKEPPPKPEWLFLGLGNPGKKYENTRHNLGFMVIDALCETLGISLNHRRRHAVFGLGNVSEGEKSVSVALGKPLTFMNLSGLGAEELLFYFQMPVSRLVVIYDDMDLEVGRVRIKPKGGPGSHNGMANILQVLGTEDFPRVRIGIGSPPGSGVDYVLTPFLPEEVSLIQTAVERAVQACRLIALFGIEKAMNQINPLQGE